MAGGHQTSLGRGVHTTNRAFPLVVLWEFNQRSSRRLSGGWIETE